METLEGTPFGWGHCGTKEDPCYCWPMAFWAGSGRCGICRKRVDRVCDCDPDAHDGKARKL